MSSPSSPSVADWFDLARHSVRLARHGVHHWLTRYPRHFAALMVALLVGGGGGALAVATLAPDAADLPVRDVMESVQPLSVLRDHALPAGLSLYRTDTTRASDSADTLLKRLGVDDAQAAAFLRRDKNARKFLLGHSGRMVSVETQSGQRPGQSGQLQQLTARWTAHDADLQFKRLVIRRIAGRGFESLLQTAPMTVGTRLASGVIHSSLFAATDDAKVPDAVATQLAEIFSGDIDFHRSLRQGDRFSVVYETLEADGEPLGSGRVLSAEFVNKGKTHQAVWFANPANAQDASAGKGSYYTLDGQSLRRAFLASPLAFSRVTSGFGMRMHPILQTMRAHQGIDYGAPTGTPVRSIGDGVVAFAGRQNGFGNVIFVKHNATSTTVYAHLSHIDVRQGQSVGQGQNIGAVGSTGWATGPHLHFEFRIHGQHRDPQTLDHLNQTTPVTASARPAFQRIAAQTRLALMAAASLQAASAQ